MLCFNSQWVAGHMTALVMWAVGEFRILHWCRPMPACIIGNKLWHPDDNLIWCPQSGFRPAQLQPKNSILIKPRTVWVTSVMYLPKQYFKRRRLINSSDQTHIEKFAFETLLINPIMDKYLTLCSLLEKDHICLDVKILLIPVVILTGY